MRSNNFGVFSVLLIMSALLIVCITSVETTQANTLDRYQSAYNPSVQMRRSNFETLLTTVGYVRPRILRVITADNAADIPGTYAKPGLYAGRLAKAKLSIDDAFIGIGYGNGAGTLLNFIFGDDIIDDDEIHVIDDDYDDDESTEMLGATFLVAYIVLIILIMIVKKYIAKLFGRKSTTEEKKAGGALSCLGGVFLYGVLPLVIIFSTAFIPWKPTPDLRHAAAAGDVKQIQEFIADGKDINININTGVWTPLAYAAEKGHLDAVKEILKHKPKLYLTPLVAAAANGHKAVWEALLNDARYSAWLDGQTANLFEIFNAAAKDNNLEMLEYLYATPLLQNAPNVLNNALVEASLKGQMKAVDWLIGKGADVNFATHMDGFTPLMMASTTNNQALVKKFIDLGANINAKSRMTQETALSLALEHKSIPIVKLLQDAGAEN